MKQHDIYFMTPGSLFAQPQIGRLTLFSCLKRLTYIQPISPGRNPGLPHVSIPFSVSLFFDHPHGNPPFPLPAAHSLNYGDQVCLTTDAQRTVSSPKKRLNLTLSSSTTWLTHTRMPLGQFLSPVQWNKVTYPTGRGITPCCAEYEQFQFNMFMYSICGFEELLISSKIDYASPLIFVGK